MNLTADQIVALTYKITRIAPSATSYDVLTIVEYVDGLITVPDPATATLPERPAHSNRLGQAAWAVDLILNYPQFASTKDAVLDLLYQGKKINAIKRLREDLGRDAEQRWISLGAAKDAVEDWRIESLVHPF